MVDSISNLLEIIEADDHIGESIEQRIRSLNSYKGICVFINLIRIWSS